MPLFPLPFDEEGLKFRSELHPELDDPYTPRYGPPRLQATPGLVASTRRAQAAEDANDRPPPVAAAPRAPRPPAPVAAPLADAYAPRFENDEARKREQMVQDFQANRAAQLENDRQNQLRAATHTVPVIETDANGQQRPQLDANGMVAYKAPPVTPDPAIGRAIQEDAYMPRRVQPGAAPTTAHIASQQHAATTAMQEEENKRAAGVVRGLKSQGVEMVTGLDGTVTPKRDDLGRVIYKPEVISPLEDRGQGNYVSVHRDRYGNEQDVSLKPKIDKETGEKYVVSADGVSRVSLGIDQDFVLRRDASESGKIAAQARGELSLIRQQQTELKTQIEDYGSQAAMIAANKNPSDQDRAKLKQIQVDRQRAVAEQDQLKELHAAKSEEATGATQTFLDKRKLIIDKIKEKQTPENFDTKLEPHEESQFQYWKKQLGIKDDGKDYDYRGAFKAGVTPDATMHWPDEFKKPNHPTFSEDSKYAAAAPDKAGKWEGNQFIPPGGTMPTNQAAAKALTGDVTAEKQLGADPQYKTFKDDLLKRVRGGELTPEQAATENETQLKTMAGPELTLYHTARAEALAGRKPYTIDDKSGNIGFNPQKPLDSLEGAVADGIIDKKYADEHRADFQKTQEKFDELKKAAGSEQVLKAILHGAGVGGAFLAGAVPGAKAGAALGAAIPGAGETGVSEAIGATLGGLATGTLAAFTARKGLQKLSEYSDAVKSLTSSAELHPVADATGELIAFGASAPRALTKLYKLGRIAAEEGGAVAGTKAILKQTAIGAGTGAAFEGVLRPAFDKARYTIADQLGIPHDQFQGPNVESLSKNVALGILTAGHNLAFKNYDEGQIASILLRGKVRAVAGVKLTEAMAVPDVVDAMKKIGVDVDSANAQALTQSLNPLEAALHQSLSKKVAKMEASGDFEGATGAKFNSAEQALIPTLGGKTDASLATSSIEATRGEGGGPKSPHVDPTLPLTDEAVNATIDELRGDAKTHVQDLQGERAMLQTELEHPQTPPPDKANIIARLSAIDKEISAVSALHPAQTKEGVSNEPRPEQQPAQRTDTPVPAAESGGQTGNRPVSDKTATQVPDEPRPGTDEEPQPGQGDVAKAERQQPDSLPADEGRRLLEADAPNLAPTATKLLGLEYQGIHGADTETPLHQFKDPQTGTTVAVPVGTTPKELVLKVKESRAKMEAPADEKVTEFLRDKDPTKPADQGGITDAAAVAMATKLIGKDEMTKRTGTGTSLDWDATKERMTKAARQILAEHKARGDKLVGADNAVTQARIVSKVNQDILDKGRWPNGKKVTPDDVARLTAENKRYAETLATVDAAAHEAATSPQNEKPIPSLAQHEADNAELGHSSIGGMPISFENPAGSIRTNVDMGRVRSMAGLANEKGEGSSVAASRQLLKLHEQGDAQGVAGIARMLKQKHSEIAKGRPWASKMLAHYGRFKGTVGKDGDHLDTYVKQGTPKDFAGTVFVVNQKKQDGSFDEHKAMVGYGSKAEAVAEYAKHYDIPAAQLIDSVAEMPWEQFKTWAREGDLTKKATNANHQQETTAVHVQPASGRGEGKGQVGPEVSGSTGEQGGPSGRPVSDTTQAAPGQAPAVKGRANRLLTEAMAKGKAKATLKALDVEIVKGEASMEMQAHQQADTNIVHYRLALNPDRIDERTANMDDDAAREYVTKGLSEEMIHGAQFEASRLTWDGKGKFLDHFASEYRAVEEAMTDEERTAVWEAYGSGIQGGRLGAEFVRQLIQTGREGTPTEATIRAKSIIERILAVLKRLLDNAASWSKALKRAYDRTSAVLDSIEKAAETKADVAAEPKPQQAPAAPARGEVAQAPAAEAGPTTSGASDELKAQAKKAFEGLFAPEPTDDQIPLPKDRRSAFFDLADKMEAEGITTPEKVAAFLDEISGGKARKFTEALWDTMAANGTVPRGTHDWPEVYSSLANRPNEANIQSPGGTNEPDTRPSDSHAGDAAAGEADLSGQGQTGGQVSGGAVSPEELAGGRSGGRPDTGQPRGIGSSTVAGDVAQPSGGDLGKPETGDTATGDRSVAGTGPDAGSGGAEVAGSGAYRNHVIPQDAETLAPKGAVAKLKANIAAIKLRKALSGDKRDATHEEKAKLAQYTGWGQFKGAFDTIRADRRGKYGEDFAWNARWGSTYDQLKKLLTPDEWNTAAESTLNAHYTAPQQIRAMWSIVERLGFKGGRVLEPAVGIGHFFGLMPQSIAANSKLYGLDMDMLSSAIARKLYPQADIKTGKFEKAKLPNNYFDLTISNFPFHEAGPGDARYPKLNLHNYFFARSFDLTKPGGLIVAITSNSTLDNNPEQRAFLQSKADLVAAIRLPNNAFLENAGTEVTTDILIFRKPDGTPFKGESFANTVQLGQLGDKLIVANEYFQRHPEMALGTHSLRGTQYAKDSYAMVADKYRPVDKALPEAIATLPKDLVNHAQDFYDKEDLGIVREGEKEGSINFRDGQPQQVIGNVYVTPDWAKPGFRSRMRDPKTRIAAAKSFVALRDKMKELQAAELSQDAKDENLDALRADLNKLYDAHVAKFGNLEKGNLKFLEDDSEYYLVMGLEIVGKERRGDTFEKVITKADALSQRTLFPSIPPTSAANVTDGAMVSMQYRGKIDIGYIAQLTGQDEETAQRDLLDTGTVFKNPTTGLLETRDAYLASNVRRKLREAEAAAKDDQAYQKNVDELKAIQPERVGFENVRARAGSAWIPEHVYTKFAQKVLGKSAKVTYSKPLDRWSVELGGQDARLAENTTTYGTERASGVDILTDVLNLKNPTIQDQEEYITDNGNKAKRYVVNKPETDKARDKARRLKSEFDDHARSDPDARQVIEDTYNDTFNSYVVPTFDGSHLVFPGMAVSYKGKPITLRPHQKDVIYRITQAGGTMMAHGVGGGKTIAQIAAAMEMRRLGQARKPLIVVDKPTIGQFAATFRQIYPNANILVATQDSFSAQNRKRFMSRIATGNWDAVVMANSQFDLMPSDPQVVQAYIQTSIDELREIAAEAEQADGKGSPKVRQLQTEIKRFESKMENVLTRLGKRQDDTIYFEQSGVDALFVDEAHAYKKVPFTTKMDPVKGIDRSPSQRAINLHPKIQFVQKNNRGRNVVLATGTPVTNTLAEAWNMMRLVAPQLLDEWNVNTFDKFVSTFASVEDSTEMNAAGRWVSVERLAKFTNGPELVKLIRTAWDVRMGEDLKGLDLPNIKGGKPETIALEVTPEQQTIKAFLDKVYDRFQALEGKQRRAYSWIPAVTMQVGIAAATDPRLIIPSLPDNPNSVVNEAIRRAAKIYHDNAASRATQIIFLDRFRPMNMEKMRNFSGGDDITIDELGDATIDTSGFNLYDDIRDKLVKAGIPREEIAIANEHDTDAKRLKMQEDMQTGRVRILMGGTSKIGQGINVQDKLLAAHHLDPPQHMTPAQYIQRNGRIVRDGNEHSEVEVLLYGMKRTMAAGIWNRIETKAKFIVQILMGKGVGRDFEDPADEVTMSIAEQVAELTGDKRILRKVELEKAVRNLQQAKEAHFNNVGSARSNLRSEQSTLSNLESSLLPKAKADKDFLEQHFGEGKPQVLKIGSQTFPDVAAFDEAFKAKVTAASERGVGHFLENPKHYSVRYTLESEINGLKVSSQISVYNQERGSEPPEVATHFSTPNTFSIESSYAKTGKGLTIVAKDVYEQRDKRIADREQQIQTAKDNIVKLEVEAGKVFTQGDELREKETELNDLIQSLSAAPTAADTVEGGSLTEPEAGLRAPEPGSAEDKKKSALVSAFKELPAIEQQVVTMKTQGKSDAEISKALKLSPVGINTAYQIALKKLDKARTTGAMVRDKFRQVAAEKPGERTLGRPELANPAKGPMSRRMVDTVDQLRKEAGIPGKRTDTDIATEASNRLAKDYAGERRALFSRAAKGGMFDDVETFMAKRIVAKEALGAVKGNSQAKMLAAAKLIDAYRMTGTEAARAFRQRQDFTMSPEDRAAEYLSQALLTPDKQRRNRMEKMEEPAQREEALREWMGQIERIKKQLAKLGIDFDAMTEAEIRDALKDRSKAVAAVRAVAAAKSDNWDALYEYWIASILSAPPTQVANIVGNTMSALWDFTAQRMTEALVNLAVRDPGAAQFGEFRHIARGILPGLQRASRNFLTAWRTEAPVFEEEVTGEPGHTKIETSIGHEPAIAGTKGRVIRTPLRLLQAADEFNKSLTGQMQVGAEAYRIAKSEGLEGDQLSARMSELENTLGSEAWQPAASKSRELAFQKELGSMGKAVINFRENVSGIRYFIPFIQTMSNIFKTGIRKTPMGSIPLLYNMGRQGMVRMNWDKSGWKYTRKDFVPHLAEQLLAWAIYFAIQGLTEPDEKDGLPTWTGTVPYQGTKRGERDLAYRTAPPMSVRIGSEWYSYARIEPAATALATMIDAQNELRKAKNGKDYTAALGSLLTHLVAQVKDKTYARGVGDILNAIEDGQHFTEWAGNFATSWVPNLIKVGARESDPAIREQKVWGRGEEWMGNFVDALKYKALPVASDVIQPKVDLWGRTVEKDKGISPATDWLFRMVSPARTQPTDKVLEVDRLITNWNNQHPNEIFAPQPPPPYWEKKVDGKSHVFYMTREEYRSFLEMSGTAARGRIESQSMNPDAPTPKDLKAISAALEKSRKEARERLWELRLAKQAAA